MNIDVYVTEASNPMRIEVKYAEMIKDVPYLLYNGILFPQGITCFSDIDINVHIIFCLFMHTYFDKFIHPYRRIYAKD
jgi:hypothetical protein